MTAPDRDLLTAAQWGTHRVNRATGRVAGLHGFAKDPDPSPIGPETVDLPDHPLRITAPAARRSRLDLGPDDSHKGAPRGEDESVEVSGDDPIAHPLRAPSGQIEKSSEKIARFAYQDCLGLPTWFAPAEWLGIAPDDLLHLVTDQPCNKLHPQLDHGAVSRADCIRGREPVLLHPGDAASRGLRDGQIVRRSNQRGACHVAPELERNLRPSLVVMATAAGYAPRDETSLYGNPNALTPDRGWSSLAQGPGANACLAPVAAAPDTVQDGFDLSPPRIKRRAAGESGAES